MQDLFVSSIADLGSALADRRISATELAQESLARCQGSDLNAVLALDAEQTLIQAQAADARLAAGESGPLLGIPLVHKDVFVTQNWKTTAGSKMLADYQSPFDATVVNRLAQAGAVCIGKANMDEFAMGSSNENSAFGVARNPWDPERIPGGSSGGSAVAVAAGLVPAATGTDTGGSIRQPASLCGITGIKPTYGRVSRFGMIAYASSLDQAGPMARSAEDCATLLSAMVGFDEQDSTSLTPEQGNIPENFGRYLGQNWAGSTDAARPLAGLTIGLPYEFFDDAWSDVGVTIEAALKEFRRLGATTIDVSLPKTELSIPVYYVLAPAEASSNLSRFDGVRYGHRASEYRDLLDMYKKTRAEGFGDEVKRRILVGTYVLSHGYYDAYYLQAQKIRRIIAQDYLNALKQCDVIMGPVSPTTAWKIGEKANDPLANYLADIYTLSASLAGLPGMSIPAGFARDGLPVGMQMIGRHFDEARMLQIAHIFQTATDWHTRRPAAR